MHFRLLCNVYIFFLLIISMNFYWHTMKSRAGQEIMHSDFEGFGVVEGCEGEAREEEVLKDETYDDAAVGGL